MLNVVVIFFVIAIFEVAQRVTARKKKKEKDIMSGQSEQIFDKLMQNKTSLVDQHLLTITLIAFCSSITFSEVSRLRHSHLVFSSTYVKVFIEKLRETFIGKGCGFTSQLLETFSH